jgi:hypothetical protein
VSAKKKLGIARKTIRGQTTQTIGIEKMHIIPQPTSLKQGIPHNLDEWSTPRLAPMQPKFTF